MKKIELLAPAGNFDCLKVAIANGANACYLGGKNFSARAFANNFDEETLLEAINYAHLRNVKIYVTVNTLLNELEINNAMKMVDFYYKNKVDALLVQDLGLYYLIKEKYPDFELHCSTQMHIHNLDGVKTAKKLGFKRVVVARESTLDFIKEACKQDIEIETFVHGAICVSYSGQCLLSSYTKNRSANKGMCAQCCRLKYKLIDEDGKQIETDTNYLLSPKDMCLLEDIPSLIQAGVSSLKIEGRMKSSAYVGYVTRMYRKAIDAYYNNQEFALTNQEETNLKVLFNRNFTNEYLTDGNKVFGQKMPNHLGIEIGETVGFRNGKVKIKLSKPLNQFDGIRINDFGCIVNMLYKDSLLVSKAKENDYVEINVEHNVAGKVYKTIDHELEESINNFTDIKLPLDLKVKIYPNEKVIVSTDGFSYISNICGESSIKAPLTFESVYKQFSKLNESVYYLNSLQLDSENAFLPVSILNEIRRSFINGYNEYRLNSFKRTVIYSDIEYKEIEDSNLDKMLKKDNYINDYPINYVINRDSKYLDTNKAVICEIGGLLKDYDEKIAYYTLNVSNSYAYEFLQKLGFRDIVISSELNIDGIKMLIDGYNKRNKKIIRPFALVKGSRALMYIKARPFDKYIIDKKQYYLDDGTNRFEIIDSNNVIELLEPNTSHLEGINDLVKPLIIEE